MSSIGPDLPPHLLAKRKRQAEDRENESTTKAAHRSPSLPTSPNDAEKRRHVMGPAPPPAPLNELPTTNAQQDEESSSDDDYGPSIPAEKPPVHYDDDSDEDKFATAPTTEVKLVRDEWMTMPPTQDGLAARMDPTKLRPGKFRSGKAAGGPKGDGVDSTWTETPEQKRKRLANEVLGIQAPAASSAPKGKSTSKVDEEAARRIKDYNEKYRGKSLYDEHQKSKPQEKEDDPSKRAFDREKDIGGGMKIGHTKRKELLHKASDIDSKFSRGSYL